nr:unnamed protein product [Digitaria exilis]
MAAGGTQQEASSPSSRPLHIVVFPWLAFGHMIPFLELSKRLARRGHAVTFVSTPRNAARLAPVPPELSPRVRVVTLRLPVVEGLPDGAESTADVPPENVELLKTAFDGLDAPFAALVGEKKPDWIGENDAHPRRTTEEYMAQPPWIPSATTTLLTYRRHEAEAVAAAFRPNASGVSDIDRLFHLHHPSCRLVIHRSCPDAEPHLFPLLTNLFSKPVVPSGLLLPGDVLDVEDAGDQSSAFMEAARWLDEQPARSVIYVALGSEAPVTAHHIRELAHGIELSGVRFLWALRAPASVLAAGHKDAGDLLPDGFERRVAGRGVVCTGWVPQVRVLGHVAVGAFLTHCGWGSTVEGVFGFGHPLVMLPFVADQGLIARAMAARGVGVEVVRDDADGSFRGEDVAAAVRRVMVEEEGEELARNARELREVVGDRVRQEEYVDELIELFQRYK